MIEHVLMDKVRQSRAMDMAERILAGPDLFDHACRIAEAGIRRQFPAADENEVRRELKRRLQIARQLEATP